MKIRAFRGVKILLVEDDVKLSTLLKDTIGESFYLFDICDSAKCALELFSKKRYDIVISDIMLPNRSGLDLAKELRFLNKQLIIILISAFSEQEKLLSAIDIGVNKYFIKPFDPQKLLDYIESILPTLDSFIPLDDEFRFNISTKSLYKKDRFVSLSKNELKFLDMLIFSDILSDDEIKLSLWGSEASDERLRTFIKRLRAKTSKELILNIKGIGYYLEINKRRL